MHFLNIQNLISEKCDRWTKMNKIFFTSLASLICTATAAPQKNEKLETAEQVEVTDTVTESSNGTNILNNDVTVATNAKMFTIQENPKTDNSLYIKIYKIVTEPIIKIIRMPKVNEVLTNIGTCMVNGAMELFSFYLPPPFLPLIASAAGFVIPFEPVVMLKEKMPVTSYRRAFNTAMSSFMRTFDKYKLEDDYDPYMTRRFNRRFMDDSSQKKNTVE